MVDHILRVRKCRNDGCFNHYIPPSEVAGCCSYECKLERNKVLKLRRENKIDLDCRKWFELRYKALQKYGRKCMCCGAFNQLQVDHIKPVSKFPHLAFDINNLQILCMPCNVGKSNKFFDDFRNQIK